MKIIIVSGSAHGTDTLAYNCEADWKKAKEKIYNLK